MSSRATASTRLAIGALHGNEWPQPAVNGVASGIRIVVSGWNDGDLACRARRA